jgi:hypothetical protein
LVSFCSVTTTYRAVIYYLLMERATARALRNISRDNGASNQCEQTGSVEESLARVCTPIDMDWRGLAHRHRGMGSNMEKGSATAIPVVTV